MLCWVVVWLCTRCTTTHTDILSDLLSQPLCVAILTSPTTNPSTLSSNTTIASLLRFPLTPKAWHNPPAWLGMMYLPFLLGLLTPVISTDTTPPSLTSWHPRMMSRVEVPAHQRRQGFLPLPVTALVPVPHLQQ